MTQHYKKKRLRLLFVTLLFALLMSFGACAKSAKYYTAAQAASWVRKLAGSRICYWNPPYKAQCTELVYYYYRHLGAYAPDTDAWQYSEAKPPSGWTKIPYYPGFKARQGDVAVWTGGSYGHVALVVSATSYSFLSLDQNVNGRHYAAFYRHTYGTSGRLTFWGVIRPNFKNTKKDSHAISSGRRIVSCVYYYTVGSRYFGIQLQQVRIVRGKPVCSFKIYYKNKLLSPKFYKVSYTVSRSGKSVTCRITGRGVYRKCRGMITVPLT